MLKSAVGWVGFSKTTEYHAFSVIVCLIAAERRLFLHYLSWPVRDEKILYLLHERSITSAWPLTFFDFVYRCSSGFSLSVVDTEDRCGLGFRRKGKNICSFYCFNLLCSRREWIISPLPVVGCTGRENLIPSPLRVCYIFFAFAFFDSSLANVDGFSDSVSHFSIVCRGLHGTRDNIILFPRMVYIYIYIPFVGKV